MTKWSAGFMVFVMALASCSSAKDGESSSKEDLIAKELLQGVWLDDETEIPLMRIDGDTIFYIDPQNLPVYFKIVRDTIYVHGNTPTTYKIDRQTEYSLWFHNLSEEIVKLHKSNNPEDTLAFSNQETEIVSTVPEIVQKDSVVVYKGTRYRGYVYINPSQMKVIKTSYSEEGISIDNVYYDNVIHICVYEGKTCYMEKTSPKRCLPPYFRKKSWGKASLPI